MNFLQLASKTTVLLALCFFVTTTAAEADYPALIVRCEATVLPPSWLDDDVRKTPTFFTESGRNICYACPPTNEYEHRVNDHWDSRQILFLRDLGVPLLRLDQPMPTCESRVRPTVRQEGNKGDAFIAYEVGFQALRIFQQQEGIKISDLEDDWDLPFNQLLVVYFNGVAGQTISAANPIEVQNFLPAASNVKHNLVYEKNEDILHTDLDSSYLHFRKQILPQMETERSINPFAHELGIEKMQLAPKDDYFLDTWKIVTFLDMNTAPVWSILLMKWNAVEIFVRKIGKMVNMNVETGITGTLELVEKYYQQNDPPVTLESRLRVPKYLWKIVIFWRGRGKAAILIIMHNDPFTERQEPLCADICAPNGWFVSNKDYRTGLIYCCQVTEQITTFLNSNERRTHDILNLNCFGDSGEYNLSQLLSGVHKWVYDW